MSGPTVAVAAPNVLASEAGEALARAGGNAVDAAVAAMAVACVTEPGICSLGGGGYATVAVPGSAPVTIDGYVAMPGLDREGPFDRGFDLFTEYGGGVTITIGHGSIATPGTPQMLVELHRRSGHAPWRDVLDPALEIARSGFPLGKASDYYLNYIHDDLYGWHEPSHAALHHPDGSRLLAGQICRPADLDTTIVSWQDDPTTFSHGDVAALIVADLERHGGALGHEDLRRYVPLVREPLTVELGGWSLATNPPPAVGGVVLALLLRALGEPPSPSGWSPADRARTVEVLRAVIAHRVDVLDLVEDRTAAGWDAVQAVIDGGLAGLTAPSTCHVSAIDRDGLAVAITCSSGYGSGVMPPGTGVWMNNCLGEKELTRRGPEGYTPGERLPSNMAPTVGRSTDGRVLAAGSPGADRITPSMMHVLAGIAGGMPLQAAVDAPRIHLTRWPDGTERLDVEEDVALDEAVAPDVARRMFAPHSMYYGGVAVTLAHSDGSLEAAADPRRDGGTAIV